MEGYANETICLFHCDIFLLISLWIPSAFAAEEKKVLILSTMLDPLY